MTTLATMATRKKNSKPTAEKAIDTAVQAAAARTALDELAEKRGTRYRAIIQL